MNIAILFNRPTLSPDDPVYEQEAGVLISVATFREALERVGHRVWELPIGGHVQPLVDALTAEPPNVVVNLCEGFRGQSAGEVHIASLLELLGVSYTGCPPECLALVHDKPRCKTLLLGAGLPTTPFKVIEPGQSLDKQLLAGWLDAGPLFVKPAREDASLGIGADSVVTDWAALVRQVEVVAASYGSVLAEPYIDGREFNVGVIGLPEVEVLPLAEIQFQTSPEFPWPIVTYESKWATDSLADRSTAPRCPAQVEPLLAESIRAAALAAYRLTGCRDYARVDLRLDRSDRIFILEVNANPDAAPDAGLARALAAAGISHDTFVERLVNTAYGRI